MVKLARQVDVAEMNILEVLGFMFGVSVSVIARSMAKRVTLPRALRIPPTGLVTSSFQFNVTIVPAMTS